MPQDPQELLREAVARNYGAVLSLPSAGILLHCKTRFLMEADGGFWVESIPGEAPLIEQSIAQQTNVGMAFKTATQKVILTTRVRQRRPDFRVNAKLTLEALLLCWPEQLKVVQRCSLWTILARRHFSRRAHSCTRSSW